MSSKLLSVFSHEISTLLTDNDEYNVTIYVGKDESMKTFRAHSLILKARCNYYKTALSKQWAKKEGDSNILRQPNISPKIFEMILNGTITLNDMSIMEVLEILSAADELSLTNLLDFIQDHLIKIKSEWLHSNIINLYQATILHAILSEELEDDIVRCHLKVGSKPKLSTDLPRNNSVLITFGSGHLETGESFLFSFGNRDLLEDVKISNVSNDKYAITLNDEGYGPCFGDKDLWMRGNFSQPDSCSSQRDDYESRVTRHQKFFVSEYEVFKIIKK
ncbi:5061_t:CDS:2 [Dentiscutata heterogama]|uniref:5061_t:CDS:1 n=1 Tax=Dentiscutata heterogama TaxID=1316150 RepID=A0ACA9M898_9GLOM|nr:5061_t:CDS:2 [Dentiscutata heterogama]